FVHAESRAVGAAQGSQIGEAAGRPEEGVGVSVGVLEAAGDLRAVVAERVRRAVRAAQRAEIDRRAALVAEGMLGWERAAVDLADGPGAHHRARRVDRGGDAP